MVSELEIIGGDHRKVGYYVGLIVSSSWHRHVFEVQVCCLLIGIALLDVLAMAITMLPWNILSDRIGRKPVLLHDRHVWVDGFHIVLWSFSHVLGLIIRCDCPLKALMIIFINLQSMSLGTVGCE